MAAAGLGGFVVLWRAGVASVAAGDSAVARFAVVVFRGGGGIS